MFGSANPRRSTPHEGVCMSYETETAGRYRVRATRLRSVATTYTDRQTCNALARIAESYELMAHVFDGMEQADLASLRVKNLD